MNRLLISLLAVIGYQAHLPLIATWTKNNGTHPCDYPAQRDSAKLLLQRIDHAFPRCVQRACTKSFKHYRGFFETDSCFIESTGLDPSGLLTSKSHRQILQQGFVTAFSKPIGETGAIEVLEYRNAADAARSAAVMDSIVGTCGSRRENNAEGCIGINLFRAAQKGNFIIRFNTYSQDPLARVATSEIRGYLYSEL